MSYASNDQITARSTKFIAGATDAQFAAGKAFADRRINSRLAPRYHVPFADDNVPDEIQEIAADIAAYFILLDRFQNGAQNIPLEYAKELLDRGEEEIKLLIAGDSGLVGGDETTDLPPASARYTKSAPGVLAQYEQLRKPRIYTDRNGCGGFLSPGGRLGGFL